MEEISPDRNDQSSLHGGKSKGVKRSESGGGSKSPQRSAKGQPIKSNLSDKASPAAASPPPPEPRQLEAAGIDLEVETPDNSPAAANSTSKNAIDNAASAAAPVSAPAVDQEQNGLESGRASSAARGSGRGQSAIKPVKRAAPLGQVVYDPLKADRTVRPKELVKDKRFWQVSRTLAAFAAGSISEKYGKDTSLSDIEKSKRKARR